MCHEVLDAGDFGGQRARADQAHHPGDVDGEIVLHLRFVRHGNQVEAGRCRLGLPHGFHCRELGLLCLAHGVTGFVAEHDDRADRGETEGGCDPEAALGKLDIAAAQQIEGRDRQHEHRTGYIACGHGMHELTLCNRIEDHGPEVGELHAHGLEAELSAYRVLHPAVGDQDPERGKVGAHCHQQGDEQVLLA
ncbi:hypothetical protein SDC9_149156 [bioreactor metagenome]|uniref:Uncharacterized protein n=1 Tax=bioreactor metagenome TaxID=1076179 RepID=A0A645EN26_9ZZZZ